MADVLGHENGPIVPRYGKEAEARWPPAGGGGGRGTAINGGGEDSKSSESDIPPPPPRNVTPPPGPEEVPRPVTPPPPPPCPADTETQPPPPVYASLAAMSTMEEESVRERVRSALLKECSALLKSAANSPSGAPAQPSNAPADAASGISSRLSRETFRRVFMQRELLERLFRLFDQDRDDLLVQEDWVEFLKARLTDEKQIDFAEQVESVAYVLCGSEPITLEKFCQIFNAKGILDKLFRLVDQDSDGVVTADQVMEFIANLSNARPRCGIDRASVEWVEKLFRDTVGDQREIRRDDFRKIMISKNPFFTERVFQIFDRDNSGSISLQEFIDAMHQFAGKSPDDKIRFLFKVYDIDGDGLIQHRELQHVMRACMEENGMRFSEEQVEDLTGALFEDADSEHRGAITYEALKAQLEKHDGLLENLSISIDRWLVPPKPKPTPRSFRGKLWALRPYQMSLPYLRNNQAFLGCLTFILALNAALFISRAYQYWSQSTYVIVARACGQCLNMNCSLVLVLVLRRCITFLRANGLSHFLPLDHHIYFHKLVGILICAYSVVHTIAHCLNFSLVVVNHPVINKANWTTWEWLGTDKPGLFGLIPGEANPTGMALVIILIVMFICSQPFVRRGGCFEVFYWTHLLYVPFWVLLIIHAPNFWKWFVGPGIIYILERGWRLVNQRARRLGRTYISSGVLLPSRVVHLVIRRPLHFDFCPGDYVFVNVPAVARYEWHPFTISSAPEQQDSLWLHVRAVGEWTNRLYDYFEREQERLQAEEAASASAAVVPVEAEGEGGALAERTSSMSYNGNSLQMRGKGLKRLQASIQRKLGANGGENNNRSGSIKSVGFRKVGGDGFVNEGFVCGGAEGRDSEAAGLATMVQGTILDSVGLGAGGDGNGVDGSRLTSGAVGTGSTTSLGGISKGRKPTPDQRLHRLLLAGSKIPLSKSLSMPDMQTRARKRERLMALREYMRSESERSFDEVQVRRARMQSLGLAYLSPQNRCVAQSFRYMRHKPTIIAFKTPSQDDKTPGSAGSGVTSMSVKGRRKSPVSTGFLFPRRTSGGGCPEAVAEEGAAGSGGAGGRPNASPNASVVPSLLEGKLEFDEFLFGGKQMAVGYPIGKPLEDNPLPGPQNDVVGAFLSDQWLPCGRRLPITFLCNTTCCRFKRDRNATRKSKCQGLPTASQRPTTGEESKKGSSRTRLYVKMGREISVDGPYGAPSSHIFRAQHAVLIGTGIGVTPFASILQSIMHRYWKARHCCPRCKFSWASEIPPTVMHLRKVDFFWINRDQRSFEWFVNLLSQLEMEQAELGGAMERFLDMHMYITSALQKTDMKAVGLQLALDLLHQKEKRDLITGLKTRTNAGRPNWEKVFKQIMDQNKGKVTVFYCGPPQLGKILRVKCDQFGFVFRKEVF